MVWLNPDGLLVYFSGERRQFQGGEIPAAGPNRTIDWEVNATAVTTTATALGRPWLIVPRNSVIESIEVISETALTSGGTPTLDVGLIRFDNTTEYDYDGLVAALPLANLNVDGEKNVLTAGVTYAGALVGKETDRKSYLTVRLSTGSYTAGRLLIRVNLYVKDVDQSPDNQ